MAKPTDDGTSQTRIKSIYTADSILETVHEQDGATVAEIAAEIGSPRSSVHHYVATLVDCNYLVKEGTEYHLGLQLLSYGEPSRSRKRIYSIGKKEVDKLASKSGEDAQIVVEEQGEGVYIYQSSGSRDDKFDRYTGLRVDLHCTAAGKAILAHRSRDEITAWLEDNELTQYTSETITERDRLFEELSRVQEEKVGYDDEEQFEGVRCVAAPVVLETGELLGAISVSGPKDRIDEEQFRQELPNAVQNTAGVIEANAEYAAWNTFD